MRILNIDNIEVKNPDLKKGYLKEDKIFIKHHDKTPEVIQQSHYEVIARYPNGGGDLKEIIDIPYQEAKDAWDEYEDIQRYIEYTPEELQKIENARNRPTQLDEIQAQITYTAMETNTLLLEQQPMVLPLNEENQKTQKEILQENIKKWYKQHLWTESMINDAASKGIFSKEESLSITTSK